MKVICVEKKEIKLKDLEVGKVFVYQTLILLKTDSFLDDDKNLIECVDIERGKCIGLFKNTLISESETEIQMIVKIKK